MSSSERDEEIFSLQCIYSNDKISFETIDETHFQFLCPPIKLSIQLPLSYPDRDALPEVNIDSTGLGISRMQMSQVLMRLKTIIFARPDDFILFDLTEEVREFAFEINDDLVLSYEGDLDEDIDSLENANAEFVADQRVSDLDIIRHHMGSVTVDSIMAQITKETNLKLLHAECVLRADLRNRFLQMRSRLQAKARRENHGRRTIDHAVDQVGMEEVVFHGTSRHNVGSIVSSGFVVPGNTTRAGDQVSVRCGTTWGQGVYTSSSPCYSLSYTDNTSATSPNAFPGQKLIVCSILMGKRHNVSQYRRHNPQVEEGYDSHISPSKMEYVVFNSAQDMKLVPDYVIDKLRLTLTQRERSEMDIARRKKLTEQARKYLPNGFGPSRGDKFVVEDIAPIDDDEEMWGDYQQDAISGGEFQLDRIQSFWDKSSHNS